MGEKYNDKGEYKPNYKYHNSRSLDSEYSRHYKQDRRVAAEKLLLKAILERALADALYSTGRIPGKKSMLDAHQSSKKFAREAYLWIISPTDPTNPICSFEWVCLHLDLDHEYLRRKVIKAKKDGMQFKRLGGKIASVNEFRLCVNE